MARKDVKVWLGFEDEYITEKNKYLVNFTTNKIGGLPELPHNITLDCPICPLCQLKQLLVTQIYAPLEDSTYHRILYVFACINPNCWPHKESWSCIRIQTLEKVTEQQNTLTLTPNTAVTDWCKDADDWDDDDFNANMTEENGNLINNGKMSDEDDESCSFDDSLRQCMGNLTVDDQNANMGAHGGAVGKLHSPSATAEIEGDEGEMISIDTPTFPQRDINALLQEVVPLPQDVKQSSFYFLPCFMNVYEELLEKSFVIDTHVRELLQEYQRNSDDLMVSNDDPSTGDNCGEVFEKYEKSTPAHGDKMFHNFLTRIQTNPGQILRYCRDDNAILTPSPLHEIPKKCHHCQGDIIFECQLLPTIISKLRLINDAQNETRLDFANLLIFTCKKSCWSSDSIFRNEFVVVQHESN